METLETYKELFLLMTLLGFKKSATLTVTDVFTITKDKDLYIYREANVTGFTQQGIAFAETWFIAEDKSAQTRTKYFQTVDEVRAFIENL